MDDKWISAADAYDRVRKASPFGAADAICSRANDGIIVARAHTLIIGDNRSEDTNIPAAFWWARGDVALTQNWPSGDFETWIDQRVHCRAYGVTFLEREIAAMLPSAPDAKIKPGPAGEGNFAAASRCIAELQKHLGCTKKEAGNHIARFCRAGLVEGRCATFWYEVTDLFGPNEEELRQVAIPPWFWERCAEGPEAILDWQSGTFAGRGVIGGRMHKVRIRGAEFDMGGIVDLESMLREHDTADVLAPARTANVRVVMSPELTLRGGRPKSENWANWIAELASYVHEEGIPQGSGAEGQDAIIGAIEERLAARGLESLGRSTVQSAVRAVLMRLRSAGN